LKIDISSPKSGKIINFPTGKVNFLLQRGRERLLWDEYKTRSESSDINGPVFILGFEEPERSSLRHMIRYSGLSPCVSSRDVFQIQDLSKIRNESSYVIINLDAFPDMDTAVDLLLQFRQQRSDVIVLMASASVLKDDFGPERVTIGDATLRLPISLRRLTVGLEAAKINHVNYLEALTN